MNVVGQIWQFLQVFAAWTSVWAFFCAFVLGPIHARKFVSEWKLYKSNLYYRLSLDCNQESGAFLDEQMELIFGKKIISARSFTVSIFLSICFTFIFFFLAVIVNWAISGQADIYTFVMKLLTTGGSAFEVSKNSAETANFQLPPHAREIYLRMFFLIFGVTVLANILSDYLSVIQTRIWLKIMRQSKGGFVVFTIIGDIIGTFIVFFISFIVTWVSFLIIILFLGTVVLGAIDPVPFSTYTENLLHELKVFSSFIRDAIFRQFSEGFHEYVFLVIIIPWSTLFPWLENLNPNANAVFLIPFSTLLATGFSSSVLVYLHFIERAYRGIQNKIQQRKISKRNITLSKIEEIENSHSIGIQVALILFHVFGYQIRGIVLMGVFIGIILSVVSVMLEY